MTVRIRVTGADAVREQVQAVRNRLKDMTPAMTRIAQEGQTFVDDRFRSETDPSGAPWPQLTPTTVEMRLKRTAKGKKRFSAAKRGTRGNLGKAMSIVGDAASQKVLQVTARLRNSVRFSPSRKQVLMRASAKYAPAHQFGRPDNKLPNASGPFSFRNRHGTPVTMTPRPAPVPARPFFPVTSPSRGRYAPWEQGPGGDFWRRVREILSRYLNTGES